MRVLKWQTLAFALGASALVVWSASLGQAEPEIRYGVIGDSYSCGEGASFDESWPAILTGSLALHGISIKLVVNPARTGWTTQQAIDDELPVFAAARPNFATVQIGVNDLVQGVSAETFRQRLNILLDRVEKILPGKERLVLVTIPDFTVTPSGQVYARESGGERALSEFNRIITETGESRGITVVDVFPLSQAMAKDSALLARDGLHPSAKEYAVWERAIFLVASELLGKK